MSKTAYESASHTYISVNVCFHEAALVCENLLSTSVNQGRPVIKFDGKEIQIKKKQNQGMLNKVVALIMIERKSDINGIPMSFVQRRVSWKNSWRKNKP